MATDRISHRERREVRRLIAMDCKTMTTQVVCNKWGVSASLVSQACREWGVSRDGGLIKHARSFRILAMLLRGVRQSDIAKDLSISKQRVGQIAGEARRAGIVIPSNQKGRKEESDGI